MPVLSFTIAGMIQAEVQREFYAHAFYSACDLWCNQRGYEGSAKWYRLQAKEELKHRAAFAGYLVDLDMPAYIPAVDAPPRTFNDLQDTFTQALALEQDVLAAISAIDAQAMSEGDHMTSQFLLAWIKEQQVSIAELLRILRWFREFGGDGNKVVLMKIDHKVRKLA